MRKYILLLMTALFLVGCGSSDESVAKEEVLEKEKEIEEQQKDIDSLEREVRGLTKQLEEQEDSEDGDETEGTEEELEDEEVSSNEEDETDETQGNKDDIEYDVNSVIDAELDNTTVTELRINEDVSVDEERYIVLVDLEWDVKNGAGTTKDMLDMYSDHLAAKLSDNESIYELVLFWTVPYHNEDESILKRTYENKEDGMYLEDEVKDITVFN